MSGADIESGFLIDGKHYPIPTLDSFNMDEAQILFDYSGLALEDFVPAHPELSDDERATYEAEQLRKVRNPAFKRALLHVAFQRGNPQAQPAQVRQVVGAVNLLDATVALLAGDDDEEHSPATESSPSEPSKPSGSETPSERSGSGRTSPTGSDEQDGILASTGTFG